MCFLLDTPLLKRDICVTTLHQKNYVSHDVTFHEGHAYFAHPYLQVWESLGEDKRTNLETLILFYHEANSHELKTNGEMDEN